MTETKTKIREVFVDRENARAAQPTAVRLHFCV